MTARVRVVTLGEAMVRLTPPAHQRLATTDLLEVHVGGAELNVAVALAQLGVPSAWVSKLPDTPLGQRVAAEARRFGVDTSRIIWTPEGRVGLYFYERGSPPRPSTVLYDRGHSAINTLRPQEVDWEFIGQARLLHLTGITPALSEACYRLVAETIRRGKGLGVTISLDVNYRSRLWTAQQARVGLLSLAQGIDILLCTRQDAQTVFQVTADAEGTARQLSDILSVPHTVVTHGDRAVALTPQGALSAGGFPVVELDRLGAGDAFAAGLLFGVLHGDWGLGLQYGMAMAALKHSIPGDFFVGGRQEVEALLKAQGGSILR